MIIITIFFFQKKLLHVRIVKECVNNLFIYDNLDKLNSKKKKKN